MPYHHLRTAKANAVVAEITAAGGNAIVFGGDITAKDYPRDLIKKTIDTYGILNHLCLVAGFTADKVTQLSFLWVSTA